MSHLSMKTTGPVTGPVVSSASSTTALRGTALVVLECASALGVGIVHVNPYFLSSQVRAAWRALPPLEVSLLPTGHCTSARIRTIRLHGAPQQRLPQCAMRSLFASLTSAAVCAQIHCRLSVM